jgi:hypothetical protein
MKISWQLSLNILGLSAMSVSGSRGYAADFEQNVDGICGHALNCD